MLNQRIPGQEFIYCQYCLSGKKGYLGSKITVACIPCLPSRFLPMTGMEWCRNGGRYQARSRRQRLCVCATNSSKQQEQAGEEGNVL